MIKTIILNDEWYLRIELGNWILGLSLEPNYLGRLKRDTNELKIVLGEMLLATSMATEEMKKLGITLRNEKRQTT